MIKTMLKPFFKKYIGLFISMVFVSMLAIGLLCTFGSTIYNLRKTYNSYLDDYGNVDEQISTSLALRSDLVSSIEGISEVEKIDARLTLDAYMKKDDGRTIVSRIFSFNEKENTVFRRYVLESIEKDKSRINISVCRKFAVNNNIKLGHTVKLGYAGFYVNFYVNEIVETAEGIYPRANDYIWSDNQDFGYLYCDEYELNRGLLNLAQQARDYLDKDPSFNDTLDEIFGTQGITMPDLRTLDIKFVSKFANQIIVRNHAGKGSEEVMNKIVAKLEEKEVKIVSKTIGDHLPYRIYMENAIKQLTVASVFLPIFFYSVTMVVIALFMHQIIKSMTSQIGVMMSIGIDKKEIIGLFLIFGLIMAIFAGLFGAFVGYGLNVLMANILITAYSIPVIPKGLYWLIVLLAIVGLLIFAEVATFISSLAISKITPKDAVISNESKRKQLPKWLNKLIEKSPMNIKLGLNSIGQNPRRFFVSSFAIFASLVLILLSCFFYVSKEEMIGQSVKRRLNFDCQVYLTQRIDAESEAALKSQPFVEAFESCYYTYFETKANNVTTYVECLGIEVDAGDLIQIPDSGGYNTVKVSESGVVLPKSTADQLGVKVGENVQINGKDLRIEAISFQYFHPMTYMSKAQMEAVGGDKIVSTFMINVNDEDAFLNYLSESNEQCLTVFTRSLARDLYGIFDAINIFIFIMIGFSLGMAFIILSIMSQNALMEQQRQLSVMRAIGFTIFDISNFWTLQSVLQIMLSSILAIPAGCAASIILFKLCSSTAQTYPFILDWRVVLIALAFVIGVVIICHLIAMFSIKKWNLADNTRSRE